MKMIRLDRQEEIEEKKDFTFEDLKQESRDLLKESNELVLKEIRIKEKLERNYDPKWIEERQEEIEKLKRFKKRKKNFRKKYNDEWLKDHKTELDEYVKTHDPVDGIRRYINEKNYIDSFIIYSDIEEYLRITKYKERVSEKIGWLIRQRQNKEKEIEAYLENEKLKRVKIRREQDAIAKAEIDEFTSKGVNGHLLEFCKKFEKKMYHCPECKDLLLDQQLLERRAEIEVQMKQLRVSLEPFKEVFLGMNELYCPTCNEVIPRQSIINMVKIEENRNLITKIIEKLEELSKNSKI